MRRLFEYMVGGAMMAALTITAQAQQATTTDAAVPEAAESWLSHLSSPVLMVGFGVFFILLIGLVLYMFGRRGGSQAGQLEEAYSEPEVESSRFEQLLAEIQGLSLRIQGGESKGYYRKIEALARIYLERIGCSGARQMSEEEIEALLNGGAIPAKQATSLASIFERCHQGAEHESEKLDFSASELLRDLRVLVKQAEETPSQVTV